MYWLDSTSTQPTFQRRINVVSMLWINVAVTLKQRCTTSSQRGLVFSQSYIETKLAGGKYGFADRLITFILLNKKNILYIVLIIQAS